MKFEDLSKARMLRAIRDYFEYRERQSFAICGGLVGEPLSADAKLFGVFKDEIQVKEEKRITGRMKSE